MRGPSGRRAPRQGVVVAVNAGDPEVAARSSSTRDRLPVTPEFGFELTVGGPKCYDAASSAGTRSST